MDLTPVINALQQIINWGLAKLHEYLGSFTEIQWLLLILGGFIVAVCIHYAWKATRPATYKLAVWGAKLGLTLVVLAFAWPYAVDLYNSAMNYTGNPIISAMAVIAGGFLGYNVIKLLFRKKKEVM